VHQVGAQDGNILLEAGQDRLADAEGLNGFLIGAGEQVLVMRHGQAEYGAKTLWQSDMHRVRPLSLQAAAGRCRVTRCMGSDILHCNMRHGGLALST
jgi:hypothetical protein